MDFLCNRIFYLSRLSKNWCLSWSSLSLLNLQQIYSGPINCNKHFSGSRRKSEGDEIPSMLSKYETFSEETAPTVLDVEQERQKVALEFEIFEELKGVNLKRSTTGVFDILEIVEILKKEKAEDIFVARIPPQHKYADYMVIVNGRSVKHMLAMSSFIRKLYKKKFNASTSIPKLEGKESNSWMAIDLGNILVHVFSKAAREIYDLETLWTVGREYDSLAQWEALSPKHLSTDFTKILASLSPNS